MVSTAYRTSLATENAETVGRVAERRSDDCCVSRVPSCRRLAAGGGGRSGEERGGPGPHQLPLQSTTGGKREAKCIRAEDFVFLIRTYSVGN